MSTFVINLSNRSSLVKLQGVPYHLPGRKACELKPGTTVMWNGGYTSAVVKVMPSATGKTCTVTFHDYSTGKDFDRRTTPDRLFAVVVP